MTNRKKISIGVLTPIIALVLIFSVLCFVTMGMYSPAYLGRVLTHWDSDVSDYKYFPARTVAASDTPYRYEVALNETLKEFWVHYNGKKGTKTEKLKNFVENTDTTSFLIVKNDKLIYEQYAGGYGKDSVNTSFSMAKSVVSLLVGKAIEEGYIRSVEAPISEYIEEFRNLDIGRVTVEQLLAMRSPIVYDEEKPLWFGDDTLTYFSPDLRKLALNHTALTEEYGNKFHYNNYHPLLLGMILERTTGVSVSKYFEEKIWRPIGAEHDASWSLDSEKSGFEKMESGINFHAVDFLKIGSMILHGGAWNGKQIVGTDWLQDSLYGKFPIDDEYSGTFLDGKEIAYRYMWYTCRSEKGGGYDIIAWGKSDQILYISPATETVILRTGKTDGNVKNWVSALSYIVSHID